MKLKNFLPAIFLTLFALAISVINYRPDTWLSGWDNLHPEFDFFLNIKRSIFAVWQEYQGLGLLGGMGHASDLPRQIILLILSPLIKLNFLRYLWISLMFVIGPLGVYKLLTTILPANLKDNKRKIIAVLGGLFYLLNLATVQIFYVPFEAFVTHYGFLPWLLNFLFSYLHEPTRRKLLVFIFLSIISATQAYVPTLFVVYSLSMLLIFIGYIIKVRTWETVKKITVLSLSTFITNAFWLLPFLYFTFTSSGVVAQAQENYMATDDVFLRNKEFGTLSDVALLKGFWFKFVDLNANKDLFYMISVWRDHLSSSFILTIGYSMFAIILIGLFYQLKNKSKFSLSLILLFLLPFIMLLNDTWPFSFFTDYLRRNLPLFGQVFRVPFTKFAVLSALSYSIFFAFGLIYLGSILERIIKSGLYILSSFILFLLIIYLLPVFQGYLYYDSVKLKIPYEYIQTMQFFAKEDKNTRIANFPQYTYWGWNHYLWGYRGSGFIWYGIAQPVLDRAFDGYSSYDENYYHEISYALYSKNVVLFHKILEKYQINWLLVDENVLTYASSKALYLDQLKDLLRITDKLSLEASFGKIKIYKVNLETKPKDFVFLAKDLPAVNTYKWNNYDKAYEEYGTYTTKKSAFADYGEFNVSGTSASQAALRLTQSSNSVKCQWSGPEGNCTPELLLERQSPHYARPTQNSAYQENVKVVNQVFAADSVSDPQLTTHNSQPVIYYPFRSLFTVRKQEELEFGVEDRGDYFSFKTVIPKEMEGAKLVIPKLEEDEIKEVGEVDLARANIKTPQIYLDGEMIQQHLAGVMASQAQPATPEVENTSEVVMTLPYILEGNLEIRVPKIYGYYSANLQPATSNLQPKSCDQFNQGIAQLEQVNEVDPILRLTSLGSSNCLDFDLPNLSQKLGYLVTAENRNIEGKSLLFAVINKNSQRSDLETYLPKVSDRVRPLGTSRSDPDLVVKSYFIQPPMEEFGVGYTLHLDNISIGRVKTVNDLGRITVNPIPYRFLTGLKITQGQPLRTQGLPLQSILVEHPNPSFYEVKILPSDIFTIGGVMDSQAQPATPEVSSGNLVLSQSYDEGWKAFQIKNDWFIDSWYMKLLIPFFQPEIKDHILINNWENGWKLSDNKEQITNNKEMKIVIVYLPQYLEYIGFGLLIITPLFIFKIGRSSNQQNHNNVQ